MTECLSWCTVLRGIWRKILHGSILVIIIYFFILFIYFIFLCSVSYILMFLFIFLCYFFHLFIRVLFFWFHKKWYSYIMFFRSISKREKTRLLKMVWHCSSVVFFSIRVVSMNNAFFISLNWLSATSTCWKLPLFTYSSYT